jgi:ATP-dependent DNA helicase RecQ
VLVVRTLLTYLELDGYLSGGTPFYSVYRFQPIAPANDILARFMGERREFLDKLLRLAKKGKTWFEIDAESAARRLGSPRERVVKALDYLGEQGWLKLEPAGTRNRYRRLRKPDSLPTLARTLHDRAVKREQQEIARLEQVLALSEQPGCQVSALCAHFGEKRTQPCGHCTRCLGTAAAAALPKRTPPPLDEKVLRQALAVRRNEPALADPNMMARWLCGITSPALTKAKLAKHPLFGALGQQPFDELRARLEKELQSAQELAGAIA